MATDVSEFRRVLGHFATGVSVVAARAGTDVEPRAMTVNALASLSLDPPLVLVCVERAADTHAAIVAAGTFGISILTETQEALSRRFAAETHEVDKFRSVAWHEEATGAPILNDALAWLDCRTWATYPGGDHTIFVGEVVAGDAREGAPLVFYRGGYGRYIP